MAEVEGSKDLISVLWSGADILRSKMDANEYKDYLLGIVFYKYLSDIFLIKVYDLIYDEKPKNLKAALDAYKEALEDESAEELKEQIKSECHYLIEPQLTYTCFADARETMHSIGSYCKKLLTILNRVIHCLQIYLQILICTLIVWEMEIRSKVIPYPVLLRKLIRQIC